eukprot:Polyplicarium_translucidae@DN3263_c0_g1_i3.p1
MARFFHAGLCTVGAFAARFSQAECSPTDSVDGPFWALFAAHGKKRPHQGAGAGSGQRPSVPPATGPKVARAEDGIPPEQPAGTDPKVAEDQDDIATYDRAQVVQAMQDISKAMDSVDSQECPTAHHPLDADGQPLGLNEAESWRISDRWGVALVRRYLQFDDCKQCPICADDFIWPRKGNLKRHLYCHLGVKPFVCNSCGKRTPERNQLHRHWKSRAQIEAAEIAEREAGVVPKKAASEYVAPNSVSTGPEPVVTTVHWNETADSVRVLACPRVAGLLNSFKGNVTKASMPFVRALIDRYLEFVCNTHLTVADRPFMRGQRCGCAGKFDSVQCPTCPSALASKGGLRTHLNNEFGFLPGGGGHAFHRTEVEVNSAWPSRRPAHDSRFPVHRTEVDVHPTEVEGDVHPTEVDSASVTVPSRGPAHDSQLPVTTTRSSMAPVAAANVTMTNACMVPTATDGGPSTNEGATDLLTKDVSEVLPEQLNTIFDLVDSSTEGKQITTEGIRCMNIFQISELLLQLQSSRQALVGTTVAGHSDATKHNDSAMVWRDGRPYGWEKTTDDEFAEAAIEHFLNLVCWKCGFYTEGLDDQSHADCAGRACSSSPCPCCAVHFSTESSMRLHLQERHV